MSKADLIYRENCRAILERGVWDTDRDVRPRWEDGAPAHTVKLFGVVNRYNLQEEFPIMTLRRTFYRSCVDELLWIWQQKSNDVSKLHSHIWDAWADENGTIGRSAADGRRVGNRDADPGQLQQMGVVVAVAEGGELGRRKPQLVQHPGDAHMLARVQMRKFQPLMGRGRDIYLPVHVLKGKPAFEPLHFCLIPADDVDAVQLIGMALNENADICRGAAGGEQIRQGLRRSAVAQGIGHIGGVGIGHAVYECLIGDAGLVGKRHDLCNALGRDAPAHEHLPSGQAADRGAVGGNDIEDLHAQQAEFPHCLTDGIFILNEPDLTPGEDIRPVIGKDDHVVEFEITPNRSDCLSFMGRMPLPPKRPRQITILHSTKTVDPAELFGRVIRFTLFYAAFPHRDRPSFRGSRRGFPFYNGI